MINCIALDDEPLSLDQISSYIEKTPYLNLIAKFKNPIDAIGYLQDNPVDLMFVDIEMPDLSGIEFVMSLNDPPKIIFTTAYSQYAVEGFKVNAVDYLLKPIGYADFLKSADRAKNLFDNDKSTAKPKVASESNSEPDQNKLMYVKSGTQHIRIDIDDITYIEGMREYIKIHFKNSKPIITLQSIKNMESNLPSDKYMRVHRSYIVNLKYLNLVERNRIILDKDTFIPISEYYVETVKKFIQKNSF